MTQERAAQAVEFKNKGNQALKVGRFDEAVEQYTKAIELDASNAIFYANRAQAHIKNEAYGLAIADSTKAIEVDPAYTKAYFRRATAYASIAEWEKALKDYKTVLEKEPGDRLASQRYKTVQGIVRKIAFHKAIEVEEGPTFSQTLDISSLTVEDSYDGPLLDIEFVEPTARDNTVTKKAPKINMTKEFISAMVERFKVGKLIPRKYVYAIVYAAMREFRSEPTLVEVEVPKGKMITVCGDTHGQFFDLLEIFRKNGAPSEDHMYLFNGDFVDRGSWSCEIAITLYCYKLLYPRSFFINRGNHETDNMNKVYGFEGECNHKFSSKRVFEIFSESFSVLPLGTLIANDYLVVHGGLFSNDEVTLDDIRKVDRFAHPQPAQEGIMMEMLWTDPQEEEGRGPSKRGVGIQFGPDVTKRFCEKNNLSAVIRSHEVRMEGYSEEHDGRLITVFSAPNYCDAQGNEGAYINIRGDNGNVLEFEKFAAQPHPDIKPMAYASNLMM
ncbi:serine/threonine-protein phosphatase T [Trichomonascus vanleenenianus]|uniref:protein serine/threonine phosphatase n=1 Tax=Trichomonascus vanleenenianus TaxID=2268995 RepID=UPI003EC9D4C3